MIVEYKQDIDASIEETFALVDNEDNIGLWMDGLIDINYAGHPRVHQVGTTFTQTFREGGRVTEYQGEVLAYEKPHHLNVFLKGQQFSIKVDYRFAEIPTGTQLVYVAEFSCTQAFAHRMESLFGWFNRRVLARQMRNLKNLAEG